MSADWAAVLAVAAWATGFPLAAIWLLLTGRDGIESRADARAHVHESFGLGMIWPLYLLIITVIGCAAVVRGGFGLLTGVIMPAHAREAERDADRLEKLTLLADAAERQSAELDRQLEAARKQEQADAGQAGHWVTENYLGRPVVPTSREAVEAVAAAWGISPGGFSMSLAQDVTTGWHAGWIAVHGGAGYQGAAVRGDWPSITGWRCGHVHEFRTGALACAQAFVTRQ